MIILLAFAFLSGLVTILAPCIWPLLPIILSSSVAGGGGHRRPLGITLGVMLSFTIFTLSVSYLVKLFNFDPNVLRIAAVVIIGFLGFCMIVPGFNTILELGISKLTNRFNATGTVPSTGFGAGFITGLSLGLVWSPCAGPILAAIATLAATGQVSFAVILITLAYVTGVGIPLFLFAYAGQRFITNSRKLSPYTARIQQVFGVIMILTAVLIYTNKAQDFQLFLVNKFPVLNTVFNGFESGDAVTKGLNSLRGGEVNKFTLDTADLFNANAPAPEFTGITKWLNLPEGKTSLTMAELKGKVVLIDFWTYTCINCVRTLPYVTSWYDKYKDDGFVIIGVHTPEFAFEKDTNNVLGAIKRFNILYPVAQDNDFATWNAYSNQYWPAHYLIDANGIVRRTHFGEGEYEEMEVAIQTLLKENGKEVTGKTLEMPDETPVGQLSPETYLGSGRMLYLIPNGKAQLGVNTFTMPGIITNNHFGLGGTWDIHEEYAEAIKDASLAYNFTAGKVFLVLKKGTSKQGKVTVLLDGKKIAATYSGKDVLDGVITVDEDRLYELVDLKGKTETHELKLQFTTPGIQAFAFTFGS